jgi:hypothetical protein
MTVTEQPTLIVPRRNFLIRALGFTVAGATVPISIVTADDAKARIAHHRLELERAWRDFYGPSADVRTHEDPGGALYPDGSQTTSVFLIVAGGRGRATPTGAR